MISLKGSCHFHQLNNYHSLSCLVPPLQHVTLDAVPIINLILQRDVLYDIGYLAIIPALQFCQLSKWIVIFWLYIMGQKLQSPWTRLRVKVVPHTAHDISSFPPVITTFRKNTSVWYIKYICWKLLYNLTLILFFVSKKMKNRCMCGCHWVMLAD